MSGDSLKSPAKDENDSAAKDCTDKPVIVATGEKYKHEVDFPANGLYGLGLSRTYRSKTSWGLMFGPNWASNFDYPQLAKQAACYQTEDPYLGCLPLSVQKTWPDGSRYKYLLDDPDGRTYSVQGNASAGTLRFLGGDQLWELSIEDRVYTYTAAGWLVDVRVFNGIQLLGLMRDVANPARVVRAQNLRGQILDFTWQGGRVTQVKDQLGNAWTFAYNAAGMLASRASPGGVDLRTYHYELPGSATQHLLTGISINGVRYSTYAYDGGNNRVSLSALANSEEFDAFTYGTHTTTITNRSGLKTTYTFATINGMRQRTAVARDAVTTCAATSAATTYDANGYSASDTDWNGVQTTYVRDAQGRLLSETRAAGTPRARSTVHEWSVDNHLLSSTYKNTAGVPYFRLVYTYHPASTAGAGGRLASLTRHDLINNLTRTTTYAYTFHVGAYNFRSLASVTTVESGGGLSRTTTLAYDTAGNLVSVTNPVGHQQALGSYNAAGLPGSSTDANGIVTTYTYDARQLMTISTHLPPTGSRVTQYSYNNDRQLTDVLYPSGAATRYRYTAGGRLNRVGNVLQEFVSLDIDSSEVPTVHKERSARHVPTLAGGTPGAAAGGEFLAKTRRDELDRAWVQSGNGGHQLEYSYDGNGNVKTIRNANGALTSFSYDEYNQVTSQTLPGGGTIAYGYDSQGRLSSVTDTRGLTTLYTYTPFGDRASVQSPDTQTTTYGRTDWGARSRRPVPTAVC